MVSIILSILKIIGIILLCILGLLITAILVVLFVPIRYKVLANSNVNDTDKDYHVTAKFSWLLCLVHGKYEYPSDEGLVVKIGPFTVYGGEEKYKTSQKKNKRKKKAESKKEQKNQVEETFDEAPEIIENSEETFGDEESTAEKQAERKSFKEKILYTWKIICDKISSIRAKIKYILANIRKYIDIINTSEFTESFALCKTSLIRLFRMIKPRKFKVRGRVGMKSPDQTGYVCAAIGVISPFFKKQIQVIPDFENFVIEGNVLIKGRVYLFVVLVIAIKMFFDKNIRRVIEMFRKEVVV